MSLAVMEERALMLGPAHSTRIDGSAHPGGLEGRHRPRGDVGPRLLEEGREPPATGQRQARGLVPHVQVAKHGVDRPSLEGGGLLEFGVAEWFDESVEGFALELK